MFFLTIPQHRSCPICAVWVNSVLSPFLPDLQTLQGQLIEKDEQRKWERRSYRCLGFVFCAYSVLISNKDKCATLRLDFASEQNVIITKECPGFPVFFYYLLLYGLKPVVVMQTHKHQVWFFFFLVLWLRVLFRCTLRSIWIMVCSLHESTPTYGHTFHQT